MISAVSFLAWVSDCQWILLRKAPKVKLMILKRKNGVHNSLHKFNKEELLLKCVEEKLDATGNKVDLIKHLSMVYPLEELEDNPILYNGDLNSLPSTISGLNVAYLREILRHPRILENGVKDEVVLRVGLLKGGAEKTCFSEERDFNYSSNIIC